MDAAIPKQAIQSQMESEPSWVVLIDYSEIDTHTFEHRAYLMVNSETVLIDDTLICDMKYDRSEVNAHHTSKPTDELKLDSEKWSSNDALIHDISELNAHTSKPTTQLRLDSGDDMLPDKAHLVDAKSPKDRSGDDIFRLGETSCLSELKLYELT